MAPIFQTRNPISTIISKLIIPRFIAEYRLFGPHGPREPGHREGDGLKVVLGIMGVLKFWDISFLAWPEGSLLLCDICLTSFPSLFIEERFSKTRVGWLRAEA